MLLIKIFMILFIFLLKDNLVISVIDYFIKDLFVLFNFIFFDRKFKYIRKLNNFVKW